MVLPNAGAVQVEILDAAGRSVRRLPDANLPAGEHAVSWDGRDVRSVAAASGVYFVRVTRPGGKTTSRLVFVR